MQKGPENPLVQRLVVDLERAARKNHAPIWARVAALVKRPRRQRAAVPLGKAAKLANGGTIVIPGRLLSNGAPAKAQGTIACLAATRAAREKAGKAGLRVVSIPDLLQAAPKGSGVSIVV